MKRTTSATKTSNSKESGDDEKETTEKKVKENEVIKSVEERIKNELKQLGDGSFYIEGKETTEKKVKENEVIKSIKEHIKKELKQLEDDSFYVQEKETTEKKVKENEVIKSVEERIKKELKQLGEGSFYIEGKEITEKKVKENEEKETTEKKVKENKVIKSVEDLKCMEKELKQLEDPPSTEFEKEISSKRLKFSFYDIPCEELAKNMLGKILVRKLDDGRILKGKIVETECYLGLVDKASPSYGGKITSENIPMYMDPGTIFVYPTCGSYHYFNISSQGIGSAVFVRAVEPLEGIDHMQDNRNLLSTSTLKRVYKVHDLCSGPSKLCIAFDIEKEHSKYSMCTWKGMWLEDDPKENKNAIKIVESPRMGIVSAGVEWARKPLRFYILGNHSVSKKDKQAESLLYSS